MNTNQIKKFATETRNRLIRGVNNQLKAYFSERGIPHIVPTKVQGGCVYGETLRDDRFFRAWQSLSKHIALYGYKTTVEEVAYTWFNRLVAINILAKNNLAEPVLQFSNPLVRVPLIVELARNGQLPQMSAEARSAINELLNDDSRTIEQFSFLIDSYCAANPIISTCFGRVDDYSYLLLPNNILAEGELIDMLNRSDYITDEDYQSPELIGWLYQFYISEKKDEVFAKKGKFESDEIPAATQIFTPNWIVKYMVQNSLGRIYLDNEPYSALADGMKYLVQSETSAEKFAFTDVKELTCADLACGSGHILNECFDLLYDIYIEQGYSRKDAVESIFAHNLVGVDIDTRAKQMATFALLLKACRRDASFADAHAMPRVLDMPDPYPRKEDLREILPHFFLGGTKRMIDETIEAIELFDKAKDLGSIMKFNISPATREAIALRMSDYRGQGYKDFEGLFRYMDIILALTEKYAVLIANPPYMGGGNMNSVLNLYTKIYYDNSKGDLATVFVQLMGEKVRDKGKYSFIIPPSWMFLPSFEKLRYSILKQHTIESFVQLSNGVFGGDFGSTTCVIGKHCPLNRHGSYFRLVDKTFQLIDTKHLEILFLNALDRREYRFDFSTYDKENPNFDHNPNGQRLYYGNVDQSVYFELPGCQIAYWLSPNLLKCFAYETIKDISISDGQTKTGDNNKYLRMIWEVSSQSVGKCNKWVKHPKGGAYRRWYGNIEWVIDWSDESRSFYRSDRVARILPEYLWWKKGISWTLLTSGKQGYRDYADDCIFNLAAPTLFFETEKDRIYTLGLLNTPLSVQLISIFNPTINNNIGDIQSIPYKVSNIDEISSIVETNVCISKCDWDVHETSWDFAENELVRLASEQGESQLDAIVAAYKQFWSDRFMQLHANEEELNRQFIEIYGLQDELTPEVPLDEITILQQGEISIENNAIVWHDDVIAKQLISYAIGCWFGRYRLDKPGLHIAHPAPTAEEVCTYTYNGNEFQIDDDGISPILDSDSSFDDNLCHRVRDFLRIVFGEDTLIENINWIEAALGKTLEAYFTKDFWKDHKKMYQNRPIYWLFSSKKGAFQCLAYMHRMDAYTVERVRSKYLLPHIEWLSNEIADLVSNEAMLSTTQRRKLDNLRKQLDECREYHDRLHVVADEQIALDLDDGVVVNHAKFGDVLAKIK